jgi:hypothetical protein
LFASFWASVPFTLVSFCFGPLVFLFDLNNHGVPLVSVFVEDRTLIESDYYYNRNGDSSDDVATVAGWKAEIQFPTEAKYFM